LLSTGRARSGAAGGRLSARAAAPGSHTVASRAAKMTQTANKTRLMTSTAIRVPRIAADRPSGAHADVGGRYKKISSAAPGLA
jgi:hypothetical protein